MKGGTLVSAVLLVITGPALAGVKECPGTMLRDACNYGGDCPDGPMFKKGETYSFMSSSIEDGHRVLNVYREGSALASDVRLSPGCKLRQD